VFFDALGVVYEYEPEGFDLGEAGWYLPDFYLPQSDIWLEMKPAIYDKQGYLTWPDDESIHKAVMLAEKSEVYIITGTPDNPGCNIGECKYQAFPIFPINNGGAGGSCDCGHYFCRCPKCYKLGIKFEARSERITCDCKDKQDWEYGKEGRGWGLIDDIKLINAYSRAKQARFEHGEKP
jgi:hypothetical protein